MATRMLIDATHDEETRVVIVKGTRLEEFDYETSSKKQLKGNIYLAKVTRVEPSLQAAFVEYGGNRHGFLPFSEIHPDYYQIPVSDREELLEQESVAEKEAQEKEEAEADANAEKSKAKNEAAPDGEVVASDLTSDDEEGVVDDEGDTLGGIETVEDDEDDSVENLGGEDDVETEHKSNVKRHYKIQEVIKRRQILLVQVVKEERGNKGAALTTYISLPGRYSVLMPNTGRGGGISRKISNPTDRKRLKKIASELDVPEGVGVIIRTAGLNRTKVEIRRDYEFLMRLWDDIRETTLQSIAPCCVYEEANLIKRSIRDLYSKDVSEILIEGDGGYRIAKDFMRKLMPSHAKKVQPYRDRIPLFHRFQVEQQFASMYLPEVNLKSGGYIVINPTEALVSIDVNSGKATKERSIEETALKTNLEAAEEISRQLRLRDLAGLVVIDFIDMDDNRNNKAVERRMKECLKSDRARIQVGRISPFGLMEMSRQRLRPSFLEASTNICHTCGGSGFVRSTESTALLIIRALEEEGVRERSAKITVTVHTDVAIYLLNQKRAVIQELENLYGLTIVILADPTTNLNDHQIEREKGRVNKDQSSVSEETVDRYEQKTEEESEGESNSAKRRRRRRRRKSRDEHSDGQEASAEATETERTSTEEGEEEPRKRRRGKRGGRRRSRAAGQEQPAEVSENADSAETKEEEVLLIPISMPDSDDGGLILKEEGDASSSENTGSSDQDAEEKPKKPRRRRTRSRRKPEADAEGDVKEDTPSSENAEEKSAEALEGDGKEEKPEKVRPRRRRSPRKKSEDVSEAASEAEVEKSAEEEEKPKKRRAPRKKKEQEPKTDTSAEVTEPKTETPVVVEAVTSEAPVEKSSEVVNVVASSDEETPKKPRRSGWWRRKT